MLKRIRRLLRRTNEMPASGKTGEKRPPEMIELQKKIEERTKEAVAAFSADPTKGVDPTLVQRIAGKKQTLQDVCAAWCRGEIS